MFDYAAGEKYKLTLIMVGVAGLMAGIFFTLLLMPTPEAPRHHAHPAWADNPDVSGRAEAPTQAAAAGANPSASGIDPVAAVNMIQQWLPLAWDLSAGSAQNSQEKAILYMTPECANAYRQNIWTPDIAKQIAQSGVQSSFQATKVTVGNNQPDGSIVVLVEGQQVLGVPQKGSKSRQVKLQYLVKNTPDGMKIAAISEVGQSG